MNVKLISVTQSEIQIATEHDGLKGWMDMSSEELIVYTARVSNPGNQDNMETAAKLIAYLIKNKHWSPFEMVDMCVEIKTSRAIAQQILRHRSFSFQEFSQRYAEVSEFEPVQIRRQAEKNRQSSEEEFDPEIPLSDADTGKRVTAKNAIDIHIAYSQMLYDSLLHAGVAKECARMILPLTTATTIYMKGSVRSWIHYLQIRTDEHTQLEHRQIALEIRKIFQELFPNISKALI